MNLTLDEETHIYHLDGRRIIGVTEALSILDDRWKVDPFYLQRGRLIHLATEYYDNGELDENTLDDRIVPYFKAYLKFLDDTHFSPRHIEVKLYHPIYIFAGKIDRIGLLNDDLDSVDLKSGTPAPVDKIQGSAYWELERANDIPVKKVFDLYLKDDSNYSMVEVEKPRVLLPVFLACLTVTRWKEGI